jgi:hypothetical protein
MIAAGAMVWSTLVAVVLIWLGLVTASGGRLMGPIRVMRWILGSWLSRLLILVAWGAAGWHIFCQRP